MGKKTTLYFGYNTNLLIHKANGNKLFYFRYDYIWRFTIKFNFRRNDETFRFGFTANLEEI